MGRLIEILIVLIKGHTPATLDHAIGRLQDKKIELGHAIEKAIEGRSAAITVLSRDIANLEVLKRAV